MLNINKIIKSDNALNSFKKSLQYNEKNYTVIEKIDLEFY